MLVRHHDNIHRAGANQVSITFNSLNRTDVDEDVGELVLVTTKYRPLPWHRTMPMLPRSLKDIIPDLR